MVTWSGAKDVAVHVRPQRVRAQEGAGVGENAGIFLQLLGCLSVAEHKDSLQHRVRHLSPCAGESRAEVLSLNNTKSPVSAEEGASSELALGVR